MDKFERNYIDGEWVSPSSTKTLKVHNPSTKEFIATTPDSDAKDVDRAVAAARAAQPAWERLPAIQRAAHIRTVAAKLREHKTRLARRISLEQGKILPLAEVEIDFTANYMDYMAEWARRIEGEILNSDRPGEQIFLHRRPIGVVAGILPWNFPFFLIARKMAPALVAGNTIVVKSSEETPLNAFDFTELLAECGLPKGVFNLVTGGRDTGAALSAHKDVGLVSFTGSVGTGMKIMEAASRNLTRVNLELGGKAPAIVLDDADLELTANALFNSRVLNTGQVCNAAERVYVQQRHRRQAGRPRDPAHGRDAVRQPAHRQRTAHGPADEPDRPGQGGRAGGVGQEARRAGAHRRPRRRSARLPLRADCARRLQGRDGRDDQGNFRPGAADPRGR